MDRLFSGQKHQILVILTKRAIMSNLCYFDPRKNNSKWKYVLIFVSFLNLGGNLRTSCQPSNSRAVNMEFIPTRD